MLSQLHAQPCVLLSGCAYGKQPPASCLDYLLSANSE